MQRFLAPPVFPSEEQTEQARMLHTIVLVTMSVVTLFLAAVALEQPATTVRVVSAIATVNVLGVLCMAVSHAGRTRTACWLLIAGLVVLIGVLAVFAGGIRSPGISAYLTLVLMAGLLLGERSGIIVGTVCVAVGLALLVASKSGSLPQPTVVYSEATLWILSCLYITIVITLQRLAAGTVHGALTRARAELRERREAEQRLQLIFNDRERAVHDLGERVKELRLLHEASAILQGDRTVDQTLLHDLIVLFPRAWQHTDVCEARIAYRDLMAATPRWCDTPWKQTAMFRTSAGAGMIEVVYLEERPTQAEGPFLAEERTVLTAVAELFVAHCEREIAAHSKRTLEEQLRQAQKMEALGRLAGGVAHDFNNLLTVIQGYSELIAADLPEGTPAVEDVREIAGAAKRASELTRQLLAFSRSQVLSPRIVSPNDIVRGMENLLRRLLGSDIEFRVMLDDTIGCVNADSGQLEQVIMNLVVNARDALTQNGVITIATARADVHDAEPDDGMTLAPGSYIVISVSDNGVGMDEDIRSRIFEPFYTTKDAGKGTGLGLATVFGIVQQSAGAIRVESAPGSGSTFSVYLPWNDGAAERASSAVGDVNTFRGDEAIILVDDDTHVRALAERALRESGYRVLAFADPRDAANHVVAAPEAPDILVTDVVMPHLRGTEVAARGRAAWPKMRVLYMTGYTDRVIESDTPLNVLQKPFTPSALLKSVRDVLDH